MKTKKKICIVITARASYARIKTALTAINNHPDLELQIVAAASLMLKRYGKAFHVIENEGFEINHYLHTLLEGENLITAPKSTGLQTIELTTAFDNLKPDAVVTIADRFETMAAAIAASYMNIPLVHIQGGEVTGNIDEKVRHAITKLADLHLVSNERAYERVLKMGEEENRVFLTGCPSIDLAREVQEERYLPLDFVPFDKYGGVGAQFSVNQPYLVVMYHPVTTQYEHSREYTSVLLDAVHTQSMPVFWFWPNSDSGSDGTSVAIRSFRERYLPDNFAFFKNMEPKDFLKLLCNSQCLIGNSSVGIRECAYLGVPVVNIGNRQQGRDRGANVLDVADPLDTQKIQNAIQNQVRHGSYGLNTLYGDGRSGNIIADVLAAENPTIEKMLTY